MLYVEFLKEQVEAHVTDECLIWPFALAEFGHGLVHNEQGRLMGCHRYAYQYVYGPITSEDIIRHSCDVPACYNPRHLLKGTHNDNVQDRVNRKRSAIGMNNGRAVLNETEVMIIYNSEESVVYLADRFGVDAKNIRNIKSGKTWRYLTQGGRGQAG